MIGDNIKRIRGRIDEAAAESGRDSGDITLVAAAKTNGADMVRQAINAGVDAVGENRVQEMLEKMEQGAYTGAPLHFIGHLQSNKIRHVVGAVSLIESIDSAKLAEAAAIQADRLGIVQEVLLEINIGREASKSGILPEQTEEILAYASGFSGIKVLGLMAIPPFNEKNRSSLYYFDAMYKLFVDMREKKYDNVSMRVLSMGMSDSFEEAIRAGANMVRIGSAIFGRRDLL